MLYMRLACCLLCLLVVQCGCANDKQPPVAVGVSTSTARSYSPSKEPLRSRLLGLRANCRALTICCLSHGRETKIKKKEGVRYVLAMLETASADNDLSKYVMAGYIKCWNSNGRQIATVGFSPGRKVRVDFEGAPYPFYLVAKDSFHDSVCGLNDRHF